MPYGQPWQNEGSITVPGGTLAYASLGEGEPIVLLHMLGGWINNWRKVAPLLAQNHRVIALDLPGHGDSESREPDSWEYPLTTMAADITAALDHLGVSKATFIGNSLGGCAAVTIAVNDPERVEKLVLISVALGGGRTIEEAKKGEERNAAWFDADGKPLPRDAAEVAKISGTLDIAIGEEQNASRAKAGRWVQISERGVALANLMGMTSQINQPVLLMYGEREHLSAMFEKDAMSRLPNGRAVHIPGSGRFPQMEQPETTVDVLNAFLNGVDPLPHQV